MERYPAGKDGTMALHEHNKWKWNLLSGIQRDKHHSLYMSNCKLLCMYVERLWKWERDYEQEGKGLRERSKTEGKRLYGIRHKGKLFKGKRSGRRRNSQKRVKKCLAQ